MKSLLLLTVALGATAFAAERPNNGGMPNQGGQGAVKAGHRLNGDPLGFKFDAWEGGQAHPFEQTPLNVAALTSVGSAARAKLQKALDQFANARPAALDRQFEREMQAQQPDAAPKKQNRKSK